MFRWRKATKLPSVMLRAAIAHKTLVQSGAKLGSAISTTRASAAKPAIFGPREMNAVTGVGALDDNQTASPSDDSLALFSSRGTTRDGFAKPEIVAPGRKIYAALAGGNPTLHSEFPERVSADGLHIRLSGTSMAARWSRAPRPCFSRENRT